MIGIIPPSGVKLSCIAVDGAVGRGRRGDRPQARIGDAEADLLALHVAAGSSPSAAKCVVAGAFGPVANHEPARKRIDMAA